jgi:hypothetical protein
MFREESPYPVKMKSGGGSSRQRGCLSATSKKDLSDPGDVHLVGDADGQVCPADGKAREVRDLRFDHHFVRDADEEVVEGPELYREVPEAR